MSTTTYEFPYDRAKEMLLVEDVDSKEFLVGLFNAMYDELPIPKSKKKQTTFSLLVSLKTRINLNSTEEIIMVGKIIGLVSCLMCAFPFLIISVYNKDSREPINFWSGDTTLKSKVKNVVEYNKKMALLYKRCAIAFLISGIGFMVSP